MLFSATNFCSRSSFASAILSGSVDGTSSSARSLSASRSARACFNWRARCFVRDRGEQFAFLQRLADRTASGRKRIGQLNVAGVLRADSNDERGFDPHRSINGGDRRPAAHLFYLHDRQTEKIDRGENHDRRDQQSPQQLLGR